MSIASFIQNIVDAANWARARYSGPLILSGASLGSGLTYHAAAAGAPVDLLVCHNLYEFGNLQNILAFSRMPWTKDVPGLPKLTRLMTQGFANLLPNLPLPYRLLGYFEHMVEERGTAFYDKWLADPVPIKRVTPKYINSMFTTKTAVSFEENKFPILVINPTADKMVDPEITRLNFERLGGNKTYKEIRYGHWAMSERFLDEWCGLVDNWCRKVGQRHAFALPVRFLI